MTQTEFNNLDTFTKAYITAAFWTNDEHGGSGDYTTSGRVEYLIPRLDPDQVTEMVADCKRFQSETEEFIAGREGTAGIDFWLTRNGHGSGFWDGDWPENGDLLTQVCESYKVFDLQLLPDYTKLDSELETIIVEDICLEKGVAWMLALGDVYTLVREELNNEILERFETEYPEKAFPEAN